MRSKSLKNKVGEADVSAVLVVYTKQKMAHGEVLPNPTI